MDNLKTIQTQVENAIDPTGPPGSIKAANHRAALLSVLYGAGKLTGSYLQFINNASNEAATGGMIVNGKNFSSTSPQVLRVSANTLDGTKWSSIFAGLNEGSLIVIKDIEGKTYQLTYVSSAEGVDGASNPVVDITFRGSSENTTPSLGASETLACGVSVYNLPNLGTAAFTDSTDYATAAQGALADSAIQSEDLAPVAFSGDYNALINKPTIPVVSAVYQEGAESPLDGGTAVTAFIAANPNKMLFWYDSDGDNYYYYDKTSPATWVLMGAPASAVTASQGLSAFGSDVQLGGAINVAKTVALVGDVAALTFSAEDATNNKTSSSSLTYESIGLTVEEVDGTDNYFSVMSFDNVSITMQGSYEDTDSGETWDGRMSIDDEGVSLSANYNDNGNNEYTQIVLSYDGVFVTTPALSAGTATNGQVLTLVDAGSGKVEYVNAGGYTIGQGLTLTGDVVSAGGNFAENITFNNTDEATFSILSHQFNIYTGATPTNTISIVGGALDVSGNGPNATARYGAASNGEIIFDATAGRNIRVRKVATDLTTYYGFYIGDTEDGTTTAMAIGDPDGGGAYYRLSGANPVLAQDFVTKAYGDANYLGGGGSGTGLMLVTEGSNSGWRFVGTDAAKFGDIGDQSVDMSFPDLANTDSTTRGARGDRGFAIGEDNEISPSAYAGFVGGIGNTIGAGSYNFIYGNGNEITVEANSAAVFGDSNTISFLGSFSFVSGINNTIESETSFIHGLNNATYGNYSTAFGRGNETNSDYEFMVGEAGNYVAGRMFNVGIGDWDGLDGDGFSVFKSGLVTAPGLTIALIDGGIDRTVLTKEWLLARSNNISLTPTVTTYTNTMLTADIASATVTGRKQDQLVFIRTEMNGTSTANVVDNEYEYFGEFVVAGYQVSGKTALNVFMNDASGSLETIYSYAQATVTGANTRVTFRVKVKAVSTTAGAVTLAVAGMFQLA